VVTKVLSSLSHWRKIHWSQRKTLWNLTTIGSLVAVVVDAVVAAAVDTFRNVTTGVLAALCVAVVASVN